MGCIKQGFKVCLQNYLDGMGWYVSTTASFLVLSLKIVWIKLFFVIF